MKTLTGASQRNTARGVCVALSVCLAGSATAADISVFSSGAPAGVEKVLAAQRKCSATPIWDSQDTEKWQPARIESVGNH